MAQCNSGQMPPLRLGMWLLLVGLLVAAGTAGVGRDVHVDSISVINRSAARASRAAPGGPDAPLPPPVWTSAGSPPAVSALGTARAFGRWFHEAFVADSE